jgi:hypothetical protein
VEVHDETETQPQRRHKYSCAFQLLAEGARNEGFGAALRPG